MSSLGRDERVLHAWEVVRKLCCSHMRYDWRDRLNLSVCTLVRADDRLDPQHQDHGYHGQCQAQASRQQVLRHPHPLVKEVPSQSLDMDLAAKVDRSASCLVEDCTGSAVLIGCCIPVASCHNLVRFDIAACFASTREVLSLALLALSEYCLDQYQWKGVDWSACLRHHCHSSYRNFPSCSCQ